MKLWLPVSALFVVFLFVTAACLAHRRRKVEYAQALAVWRSHCGPEREFALRRMIDPNRPQPGPWYLIGCACLSELRARDAARAFGMAYHADCGLESAALLTFACLKAREGSAASLLDELERTWDEMNRPALTDSVSDRLLQAGLDADASPPAQLPEPLRLAWRVLPSSYHAEIFAHANRPS